MYCRISHQREKGPKSVLAPGYRSDVEDRSRRHGVSESQNKSNEISIFPEGLSWEVHFLRLGGERHEEKPENHRVHRDQRRWLHRPGGWRRRLARSSRAQGQLREGCVLQDDRYDSLGPKDVRKRNRDGDEIELRAGREELRFFAAPAGGLVAGIRARDGADQALCRALARTVGKEYLDDGRRRNHWSVS